MAKQDAVLVDEVEELSDAMEEEPTEKVVTGEEIQQGIAAMLTTLESARIRPSPEAPEDQQAAKKAKLEHQDGAPSAPAFGSAALEPFGKPGK